MNDYEDTGLRWQSSAILALQEATEAYLVHLFEDACVYTITPFRCPAADTRIVSEIFVPYTRSA